jgi:hypothetical protein
LREKKKNLVVGGCKKRTDFTEISKILSQKAPPPPPQNPKKKKKREKTPQN